MVIGGMPLATWFAAHITKIDLFDLINAAFVLVVSFFWLRSTVVAWREEEIKGLSPGLVIFYIAWTLYTVWLFGHLGQPISFWLFIVLAASQISFLFTCWVFVGPFNYDKRSHRARWWFLRLKRRAAFKQMIETGGVVDMSKLPKPPEGEYVVPLPKHQCNVCGFETRHDLDGHCIICDTKNRGN